jgi:hypothetical protein
LAIIAGILSALTPGARGDETPPPANYAGYVLGLHVFDMTFSASLQPSAYRVAASFRLAGALAAFWHAEGSTTVSGQFVDGQAAPRELVSTGRYSGVAHILRINWKGGSPDVIQMVPPQEKDREPVPAADKANTVDTLSAIAALIQRVAATGRCDTTARTYDGTRLGELSAETSGQELLKPTDRSSFQGEALRCDLTVRMLGGFLRDDDNAEARRPKKVTVWVAKVQPGGSPIAVRAAFNSAGSPGAMMYLK